MDTRADAETSSESAAGASDPEQSGPVQSGAASVRSTSPTAGAPVRAQGAAGASTSPSASSPPPPRIVASIIDPTVRDDGRGDPQFSIAPEQRRSRPPPPPPGGSHPVRDRLLARARAALDANSPAAPAARVSEHPTASARPSERPRPDARLSERASSRPPPADDWDAPDAPVPGDAELPDIDAAPQIADDLDLIGAPERRRLERTPPTPPVMRAPTALVVGTIGGVAIIAALFALLVEVDPHQPLRAGAPAPAAPVASAAPDEALAEPPPAVGPRLVERPPRAPVPPPWRLADAASDPGVKRVQGSVGERSFLAAAQATGITRKDVYRLLDVFEGIKNLDRCRPRDSFSALLDANTGRLTAFEYVVSDEEVYQAREGSDGRLAARKLDLAVKRHRVQGVVIIDGSFEESALRAGFEPGLSEVVNKALNGYVSTADLRTGDVLGIVAQEVTMLGNFARYAGVEALEYRPQSGDPLRIYYRDTSKNRGYVDSKGRVFGKSRWTRPVPGASVTSRFNPRRLHPILRRIKPHNGTDYGAPIGTPVVAAAAGRISFVGRAGPNGNMVTLSHGGGLSTGYSHLSRFAKGLRVGTSVDQKQVIGYVGSTGRSTGPHLHFSAKKNGRFIDPESLNLDGLSRLALAQRLPDDVRRRYDRMLDALHLGQARQLGAELARAAREHPGAPRPALQLPSPASHVPSPARVAQGTLASAGAPSTGWPAATPPAATPVAPLAPSPAPALSAALGPDRGASAGAEGSAGAPLSSEALLLWRPAAVSLEPEPASTLPLPPQIELPQSPDPAPRRAR